LLIELHSVQVTNEESFDDVKVYGPYSLSKDALREEETLWLIKCQGEDNLSNVGHFNTPPHVWQLMAKHVDNNGRKMPSSQETCGSDIM
jgi:cbb3-type cytochrome oxidase cytochrome c subunit